MVQSKHRHWLMHLSRAFLTTCIMQLSAAIPYPIGYRNLICDSGSRLSPPKPRDALEARLKGLDFPTPSLFPSFRTRILPGSPSRRLRRSANNQPTLLNSEPQNALPIDSTTTSPCRRQPRPSLQRLQLCQRSASRTQTRLPSKRHHLKQT